MVTLANGGAWLVNGAEIIADGPKAQAELAAKTGRTVSKEEAKKQTIAYGILENHNTSGSMEKLKIKFDKLTSHDITSVSYTHLDVYKRQALTVRSKSTRAISGIRKK